jgi:hypothetical protein
MAPIGEYVFEQIDWRVGDVVEIVDQVDPGITNEGTIKFIEQDNENATLFWLYIVANEEVLNDKPDPKIGMFWELLEHTSDRITLLSRAVL